MSNEDNMREEFEFACPQEKTFARCTEVYFTDSEYEAAFEGWKACAAIKDAEIADITKRKDTYFLEMCEVIDKNENLLEEIASRNLMIKELREALDRLMLLESRGRIMPIGKEWDAARKALANSEHHNSRALEKMLLGAELKGLNTYDDSDYFKRKDEVIAKLAELNKE